MTMQDHKESTIPMLITKLDQHLIILEKLWIKKHGVILDMKNDQLIFWPGYCQHVTKLCVAELHLDPPRKIMIKQLSNASLKLLPYLLSSTPEVSKVLSSVLKDAIP